jgi:hypothetical protein
MFQYVICVGAVLKGRHVDVEQNTFLHETCVKHKMSIINIRTKDKFKSASQITVPHFTGFPLFLFKVELFLRIY